MSTSSALARDAFETLPMLDAPACALVVGQVMALSTAWVARHPQAPFYTLGAPSYLDAVPRNLAPYQEHSRQINPILEQAFASLYERLTGALASLLGKPVELTRSQALPGFHIFLAHPAFERSMAPIHVDLQHEALDWAGKPPQDLVSFTLPVALPAAGGGMDVWAIDRDEWLPLTRPERLEVLKRAPRRDLAYSLGALTLHSGRLVHRIAATRLRSGDRRFTLQGHGALIDGRWQLYW
jgi:hypothetical protein